MDSKGFETSLRNHKGSENLGTGNQGYINGLKGYVLKIVREI